MSGLNRPQAPRISTNVNKRSANGPCALPYANSPSNARSPSEHSTAQPDSMNARKRPAEPHSRGNSPPDKRVRPPKRSLSTQDRCANVERLPSLASPPPSRKGSLAILPDNIPTGPRGAKDARKVNQYRSGTSSDATERRGPNGATRVRGDQVSSQWPSAGQSPLHMMSPASAGSGGSTPVHGAPPAPSMLSRAASASALPSISDRLQQHDNATSEGVPMTMASLQKLKLRKLAIANEAKGKGEHSTPRIGSLLSAKFTAQQMEITQLRKEREQLSERLNGLESLPDQIKELTRRLDQTSNQSESVQAVLGRVTELEKLMPPSSKVGGLEATMTRRARETGNIVDIKHDIEVLKSWREAQSISKTRIEEKFKESILEVIASRLSEGTQATRTEITALEARLVKQIEENHKSLETLSSNVSSLETFRNVFENEDLPKLRILSQKVRDLERNEQQTYDKTKAIQSKFDTYVGTDKDFEGHGQSLFDRVKKLTTVCGQVKTVHSERSKLSNEHEELTVGEDDRSKAIKALEARLDKLEMKANGPGPGLVKVRNTIASSATNGVVAPANAAAKRLDQLDKDIKELRQSLEDVQPLSTQTVQKDERLKAADEYSQQIKTVTAKSDKMTKDLTSLESRLSSLDQVAAEVKKIQSQMTSHRELQSNLSDPEARVCNNLVQSSGLASSDETGTITSQIMDINDSLKSLDQGLTDIEETLHDHSARLKTVQEEVPELFRINLDPFKQRIEQRLEQINQTLHGLGEQVEKLKEQPSQHLPPPERNITTDVVKNLKQEMTQLQTMLRNEATLRHQAIRDVKHQITQKADITATDQQMDSFRISFRNLQDQYNNITTDELHGRMVQWFLQNNPSNTANLLQQYASLQQDVRGLQALSAQISWIQAQSQNIAALVASAPQLQSLLESAAELSRLPQTWARIDEACKGVNDAVVKVGVVETRMNEQAEQIKSIQGAVNSLQKLLHDLNSNTSPLVKARALHDMENLIRELQARDEKSLADERQARVYAANERRLSADTEHDKRMKDIEQIKSSLESCNIATTELSKRVEKVETNSSNLRLYVDTINDKYIEPNRDVFGLFGNMLLAVGQLQWFTEQLNQNLPKGAIAFTWAHDFNDDIANSEGKDRSKQ